MGFKEDLASAHYLTDRNPNECVNKCWSAFTDAVTQKFPRDAAKQLNEMVRDPNFPTWWGSFWNDMDKSFPRKGLAYIADASGSPVRPFVRAAMIVKGGNDPLGQYGFGSKISSYLAEEAYLGAEQIIDTITS